MICPLCKSDKVTHWVGGNGVIYRCHNPECRHGWLEEFNDDNRDRKVDSGSSSLAANSAANLDDELGYQCR